MGCSMIFIGYSSKDRYSVVESMVFHLKNYGFNVWYDFHDMFLGDNRYNENFELGIGKSKYVIFILSNNFFHSKCAIEELRYAQELYEKGEITLLPILYIITIKDIPDEFNWIKKIIYNEVNEQSGTLFVTNQIIEKMLHDTCKTLPLRSFPELSKSFKEKTNSFLYNLCETYLSLDIPNYSARISLLYAMYLYIGNNSNTTIDKIIRKTISFTSLNISLDHLSFSIFRLAVLIAINNYLQ